MKLRAVARVPCCAISRAVAVTFTRTCRGRVFDLLMTMTLSVVASLRDVHTSPGMSGA